MNNQLGTKAFAHFDNRPHDAVDNMQNEPKGSTMNLQNIHQRRSILQGFLALLMGFALFFSMALGPARPAFAAAGTNTLFAHERLYGDQFLVSANGRFRLYMQGDGNLVLYDYPAGVALWATNTFGRPGAWLGNQGDGNLVLYHNGVAIWHSGTYGHGPSNLIMQDDGNLVLYKAGGVATWASGTATPEKLSDSVARQMLANAGIAVVSSGNCSNRNYSNCTSLEQVRSRSINGLIAFKRASGCPVTVTGGTEVGHSSGTYSHWNGYKLDISPACVTDYIYRNYPRIGNRSDGAPQYKSGAGDIYAYEYWANHWDILYY